MMKLKYLSMFIFVMILVLTCIKSSAEIDAVSVDVYAGNTMPSYTSTLYGNILKPIYLAPEPINELLIASPTAEEVNDNTTESEEDTTEVVIEVESEPIVKYSDDDIYIWAKIVMAEAEGESQLCKEYVAQTIINRVESDEFPNTIYDVIFQKNQFTPTFNGRWERVEPNQDCYDAVYTVLNAEAPIIDSLYFECCKGESWHSRNLELLEEEDGTRFYK